MKMKSSTQQHKHESGGNKLWPATISLTLLFTGIIMNMSHAVWFENSVVQLLWFIAAFLPVGVPVFKEAIEAILQKDIFNEFTLMAIACMGAFCIGEYPEAVAVMLFYSVGEMLQDKAVGKATRNIRRLLDVRPEKTMVLREGKYCEVSPKNVNIDDVIEVRPGERVPLDGVLLSPSGLFDTSALTGESLPRIVENGGEVLAGMIVSESPVRLRVNRLYDNSALAKILDLVKEASERKAPAELFIRKFARIYTPVVLALAMLVVVVPALCMENYNFSEWLYRALVFLVISCPCALVISVPLGYFAGIGAASRAGILFKGGNYLDALASINAVAFDKTGTMTTGTFEVSDIDVAGITQPRLLSLILSLEQSSTHPMAMAASEYARKNGVQTVDVRDVKEIAGHGVEADFNGKIVLVGNIKLMQAHKVRLPESFFNTHTSLIICAINGKYAGALMLSDALKEDAAMCVEELDNIGIDDLYLVSGDNKEVVRECAEKLGIHKYHGEMFPADKAAMIERLMKYENKKVAFVGDGMNDAPVLALSNVGVAMGGLGSDAAVESADVVIQDDKPSKLVTAISISRKTRRIVTGNIAGAISIKVIILIAGLSGIASLWMAVFADVGVSLLAVMNSLRILRSK